MEYKGAKITARALTIEDDNTIQLLAYRLEDSTSMLAAQKWSEFLVAAVVDGDYPIPYVSLEATAEEARHSYAAWKNLPRSFLQHWRAELGKVETDPKE